jgi:hypothetical protein
MATAEENYKSYMIQFDKLTDEEIVSLFNKDVNNPGWVSRRGAFLSAIESQFVKREIDYTVISHGQGLKLTSKVKLEGKKLTLQ